MARKRGRPRMKSPAKKSPASSDSPQSEGSSNKEGHRDEVEPVSDSKCDIPQEEKQIPLIDMETLI